MSEINDIEEISEGNYPINLKLIQQYQWSEPILMAKYKNSKYHKGYIFLEVAMTILALQHVMINCYSIRLQVMYKIGTISIYFVDEWIEQRQ